MNVENVQAEIVFETFHVKLKILYDKWFIQRNNNKSNNNNESYLRKELITI